MSSPLLLEGRQEYVRDQTPELRREIERLVNELRFSQAALQQLQEESQAKTKAIASLRRQLSPLYRALQGVFGELEHFDMEIDEMAVRERAAGNSKWDAIKQRLAPRLQAAIDVFLAQGGLTNSQLAVALKMNRTNCSNNVSGALLRQGLLVKNGNTLSLKQL